MAGPNKNVAGAADDDGVDESLFPTTEDLSSAEEAWSGGREQAEKARPQGPQQVTIEEASLERSSSSQKLQIHYTLKVATGPFKDEVLNKYDGLDTPQRASISQQQLRRLGVDTTKVTLKTLPASLLDLNGKMAMVTCKTNGDFYNIYFNKLVGATLAGPRPGGGGGKVAPAGAKKKF